MKQMLIEISDPCGVMPHNAATFKDAITGTREFIRNLLADCPPDIQVGAKSLAQAFEPLNWLLEDAVITDRIEEKGGEA